ncbi:Omega-hydroxypalmitate O-feruloyl [Musa troglodytarum]|uniref:Omega-hydroxypalmitate O-feruloyl n=1 Tax=Musa troglodytarum TaxID=320322 RepID=A0A9E7HQN7_9LILI|nr:Omega-hydroxypalmitate O-feruloyl [Musa troglodytarum]
MSSWQSRTSHRTDDDAVLCFLRRDFLRYHVIFVLQLDHLLCSHTTAGSSMGRAATEIVVPLTELDVERGETCALLSPSNPTPMKTIHLSNIDQTAAFPVETVFFYETTPDGAESTFDIIESVKRSVSEELLVPYYFMAGRVLYNVETKRLELVCNNAGALFAGATSSLSLKELGDLSAPNRSFQRLVLRAEGFGSLPETPIFTIQVTRFRCGGFSIGFMTNHSILDGKSAVEMLENLAAICRGEGPRNVKLHVDRSCIQARDPPQIQFEHAEYMKLTEASSLVSPDQPSPSSFVSMLSENYEYEVASLSLDMIDGLKERATTGCSSFQAVVAHLWRARTRAVFDDPSETSSVLFAVDVRSKMTPRVPDGFVGNAVAITMASARVAELTEQPLGFAVKRVREAIERVTDEYIRSAVDWLEVNKGMPAIGHGNFIVSAWWKLPFHELDFGWGKPIYGGPVVSMMHECVLLLSDGKGGINIWLALEEEKMKGFVSYVYEL